MTDPVSTRAPWKLLDSVIQQDTKQSDNISDTGGKEKRLPRARSVPVRGLLALSPPLSTAQPQLETEKLCPRIGRVQPSLSLPSLLGTLTRKPISQLGTPSSLLCAPASHPTSGGLVRELYSQGTETSLLLTTKHSAPQTHKHTMRVALKCISIACTAAH